MKEYIERQAAIDDVNLAFDEETLLTGFVRKVAVSALKLMPAADVVPVVKCRDCKYCIVSRQGKLFCIRGFEQTITSAFAAIDNPIFEREFDSFCSYGERRE